MKSEELLLAEKALLAGLNAVVNERYSITASYVVCFYDWMISLDQEVALIYPSRWNAVKAAYLFCRYYPLVIAPFHFWGLIGDHERRVCELYYHALFASTLPMMWSAQFILLLRTYAFTGRKKVVLACLSVLFLGIIGVTIWVTSTQLSLSLLSMIIPRGGCFAYSDQPTFGAVQVISSSPAPKAFGITAYHLGIITILTALFDGVNTFLMVQHCIRVRGALSPLGQTFLRQGLLVYFVMTIMNTLTIGTYFFPLFSSEGKSIGPWFTNILPSVLSCRLVLMLRQKASPTETELRVEHSHMVDAAFEVIRLEPLHKETSECLVQSTSTDAEPQT